MSYKNKDVAQEFVNYGIDESIKSEHFFFEQDVLFSYGYHFPMCIRLKDGWVINKDGYSRTTGKHKGLLINALNLNYKEILKNCPNNIKLLTTSEIKNFLTENVTEKGFRFITFEELNKLRIIKEL